jgi:hypothetical protein
LGEREIGMLIRCLAPYDVYFEVTCIEMQMQTSDGLTLSKLAQAEAITENLTQNHYPALVDSLKKLQTRLEGLSNQLYTQAVCTWELIANVIQKATLYYVQRLPKELGQFHWFVDAKDKTKDIRIRRNVVHSHPPDTSINVITKSVDSIARSRLQCL